VGYLVKAILGFAIFLGGLVLFNEKLVQLLEIGTCASGNTPYAIRNPCPAGTGTAILLLIGGVFASLIGAFMFALRGEAPWGRGRGHRVSTYATLWGIGFAGTGAVALVTGLTDDSLGQGGELGAIIVGATFLVMGAPALLAAIWSLLSGLGSRDESAMRSAEGLGPSMGTFATAPAAGAFETSMRSAAPRRPAGGQGDRIAKLKTLADLRQSGALTQQEFEREKARFLGES
jgi:hypothetical protein